jgi:diadenosine tetraphosphate (Ap4A) HIT family hydrolase
MDSPSRITGEGSLKRDTMDYEVACIKKGVSYNKSSHVVDCIICKITKKLEPGNIIYEDSDFCVFTSIKPASSSAHLLVTPREHIRNIDALVPGDVEMIEKMVEIGSQCLSRINPEFASDATYGFHKPPLNSIDHLHLHAIAMPLSGIFSSIAYGKWSPFLVPPEIVIANLRSMSSSGAESTLTREKLYLYNADKN